jgi:hypothetical protein
MKRPFEWPSRERWAEQHQRPYWDEGDPCPYYDNYSHQLSDYATPEEITALTASLKERYRELGRELKAANLRIKPWRQQRGEGQVAWYRRFRQLPVKDQEALHAAGNLRDERSNINDLLTKIRNNEIPNRTRNYSNYVPGKAGELVAPFNVRYDAAFKAARDAYLQEYAAQHPPDDAAWDAAIDQRYEERQA